MPTSTNAQINSALQNLQSNTVQTAQTTFAIYNSYLPVLEIISVIITTALVVAIVRIAIQTGWWRSRVERFRDVVLKADLLKEEVRQSWETIEEHSIKRDENDLKVAIIEADKLLDNALRSAGVAGTQIGDRLKTIREGQLPNLDDVWQAHKLRNKIAHESGFVLRPEVADRALAIYRKALAHLGVMDEE